MQQANGAPSKQISDLSFEEALEELKEIVSKLESGEGKLDDAVAAYERGVLLKRHCEAKLKDAQMKIESIQMESDGTLTTKPFEA